MKHLILRHLKSWLTRLGARLSPNQLQHLQAVVNYMLIGRWMRDHDFRFPQRVATREDVYQAVANRVCGQQVLYLEFGVATGASMQYWSAALKHPKAELHGFDSFEGLPEKGGPWQKGQFAQGAIPKIADPRVHFFKGWFDQVLPTYTLPANEVLVINMDADLYSSTIFVLRHLRLYIKKGTFIYFDEMNHVEHEPRAFDEFTRESGLRFKSVCADKTLAFVFFECTGPSPA